MVKAVSSNDDAAQTPQKNNQKVKLIAIYQAIYIYIYIYIYLPVGS